MNCPNVDCPDNISEGIYDATVKDAGAIILDIIGIISTITGLVSTVQSVGGAFITLAGFVVPVFIAIQWGQRCLNKPEGVPTCMAGIVDSLTPPETSNRLPSIADDVGGPIRDWADDNIDIFPFLQEHPSFNMVVKCKYWPELQTSVGYYRYNHNSEGNPIDPIVTCYLKDPSLCDRLQLMAVGSLVGAAVGTWLGNLSQGAILAACAATVICGILALFVFLVIAIVGALIGAKVGDAVYGGRRYDERAAEQNTEPGDYSVIPVARVGDYLAVKGKLIRASWLQNGKCFWFVEEAFWYGHESNNSSPFSHCLPDLFMREENESGVLIDSESRFCAGSPCLQFHEFGEVGLELPATVRPGWYIGFQEPTTPAEFVTWGEPEGKYKLFISGVTFFVVVSEDGQATSVSAKVGWGGGTAVTMIAYDRDRVEVGRTEAPRIRDEVHEIKIVAPNIRHVEFVAQEGLIIETCAEVSDL